MHQKVSLKGKTSNNIGNYITRFVGFVKNIMPGFSEENFNLDSSDNITHKQKRNTDKFPPVLPSFMIQNQD